MHSRSTNGHSTDKNNIDIKQQLQPKIITGSFIYCYLI